MKQIFAAFLSCLLLIGVFALPATAEETQQPLVGGWQTPDSPDITPELQEIFEKATEGLLGVDYTPLALTGTQLVAGMNYRILCEARTVVPDAEPYYVTMTIYKDLEGNASVTDIEAVEAHSASEVAAFVGSEGPSEDEASGEAEAETSCGCSCCCSRKA